MGVDEHYLDDLDITNGTDVYYTQVHRFDGNMTENDLAHPEDYPEGQAALVLWSVLPPVLLVLGTTGNILSLLVMTRPSMRTTPMGIYLSCLAATDLICLWVGLTRHMIYHTEGIDVRKLHSSICKLHRFVLYFAMDFSAWTLVAVSVERFISVCLPTKAVTYCTVQKAKIVLCIIAAMTLINMHVFWTRGKEYRAIGNETLLVNECGYPTEGYRHFWVNILPWIIFCIYAAGPFVTMLILNIFIIRGLIRMNKSRSRMTINKGSSSNLEREKEKQRQQYTRSMTIMLVCVSISFLILSLPGFINRMVQSHWKSTINDPHERGKYNLVEVSVIMLNYANHSLNFFLYCLTGKRFREELKGIFINTKCCKYCRTTSKRFGSKKAKKNGSCHYSKCDGYNATAV